jgi:hypothetical protein
MGKEAWLGFYAFNTEDPPGSITVDFIKYRQLIVQGAQLDDKLFEQVLDLLKNK